MQPVWHRRDSDLAGDHSGRVPCHAALMRSVNLPTVKHNTRRRRSQNLSAKNPPIAVEEKVVRDSRTALIAVHGKQGNDRCLCALGQSMVRPFCYGSYKNFV